MTVKSPGEDGLVPAPVNIAGYDRSRNESALATPDAMAVVPSGVVTVAVTGTVTVPDFCRKPTVTAWPSPTGGSSGALGAVVCHTWPS